MKKFSFKIDHIDPLGQGVSKETEKVAFIPKTLPGETGEAHLVSEKKGVMFGQLISTSLKDSSENRINPECPHYSECSGCHYLHTDYQTELEMKRKSLEWGTRKFESSIHVHSAPERFHYRNRIQLHYETKQDKLGFRTKPDNQILEVPNCLLPKISVGQKVKELYQNAAWKSLIGESSRGHIEVYEKNGQVQTTLNRPYAEGGFTQVNDAMNQKLKLLVQNLITKCSQRTALFDLFGGAGNLSQGLDFEEIIVLDSFPHKKMNADNQKFVNFNLYQKQALEKLKSLKLPPPNAIIIDPPRSGWKELGPFLQSMDTSKIIYVSCNPATLFRDLQGITNQIKNLEFHLLDLFPGTFHYEVVAAIDLS